MSAITKLQKLIILFLFVTLVENVSGQQRITFPSLDSLPITADLYKVSDTANYIVLCHLSEHSRGEYRSIAKRLNAAGYNCLAIDTRTGNEIFGILNETNRRAKLAGKATDFLNSEQDIVAAINYADSLSNGKGIILLGSSFSASLSLKIATTNKKVNAVIAFSPGEHFGNALILSDIIRNLDKPVLITSSKAEAPDAAKLFQAIRSKQKVHFIPNEKGAHGAIALWDYNTGNKEYWNALFDFLKTRLL
jgi:dienelactone hydrolase